MNLSRAPRPLGPCRRFERRGQACFAKAVAFLLMRPLPRPFSSGLQVPPSQPPIMCFLAFFVGRAVLISWARKMTVSNSPFF